MRISKFKINRILPIIILIGPVFNLSGLTLSKAQASSDISAYTGSASVVINGNMPTFT